MTMPVVPKAWLYPTSLTEASLIQKQLAARVITEDKLPSSIRTIGGMDVSQNPRDPKQLIYATLVVLDAMTLEVIAKAHAVQTQTFPYVPGFLGFRESPALLEAAAKLTCLPDLIFVDGHGISHPRGLGIASHIGVLLDKPTIGVAKSILVGKPASPLGEEPLDQVPLIWKDKSLATMIRSKRRCKPLIISTGHKVAAITATQWVIACLRGYRLPEPTRQAHLAANLFRKHFTN